MRRLLPFFLAFVCLGAPAKDLNDFFSKDPWPQAVFKGNRIAIAGDLAQCAKSHKGEMLNPPVPAEASLRAARTAQILNLPMVFLGDLVYPDGTVEEYRDCFDPLWRDFRKNSIAVPGNHDYNTPHAAGYRAHFGIKADEPLWFSRRQNGWLFIGLDSNLKGAERDAQIAWLTQLLKTDRARHRSSCIAAFWHHPLAASSARGHKGNPNVLAEARLLAAAKADLFLVGHEHFFEAQNESEATLAKTFIVGTGGASGAAPAAKAPERRAENYAALAPKGAIGVLEFSPNAWSFSLVQAQEAKAQPSATETLYSEQGTCKTKR